MKLRDLVLHNFRLKLFSLLMAVLVWVVVRLYATRQEGDGSFPAFGPRPTQSAVEP